MRLRFRLGSFHLLRRFLAVAGLSLLAWCGYVLADSWWFQRRAIIAFTQPPEFVLAAAAAAPQPSPAKDVVGLLVIKRLGLSVIVLEGSSAKTLRRAAGHITGTALPGQPGNIGVSGHRDTFFRSLENIRRDDIVTFKTKAGEFQYRVVSVTIVPPDDVAVLAPSEQEVLTLVTCYPFSFIGAAPERYIIRADRIM